MAHNFFPIIATNSTKAATTPIQFNTEARSLLVSKEGSTPQNMTLRTGAARFLTLPCFWLAALMAIGAVTVARSDPRCESLTNPYAFNKHAILSFSLLFQV
jgi:hypothetical protein